MRMFFFSYISSIVHLNPLLILCSWPWFVKVSVLKKKAKQFVVVCVTQITVFFVTRIYLPKCLLMNLSTWESTNTSQREMVAIIIFGY